MIETVTRAQVEYPPRGPTVTNLAIGCNCGVCPACSARGARLFEAVSKSRAADSTTATPRQAEPPEARYDPIARRLTVPGRAPVVLDSYASDPVRSQEVAREVKIAALAYPNPSPDDRQAVADAEKMARLARIAMAKQDHIRQAFQPQAEPEPALDAFL